VSQQEVYNILNNNPNKIFTIKDLIGLVNINPSSLSCSLKKLRLGNFINCIIKREGGKIKHYYSKKK
jgi:DNA-binding MarR family transcriptional regulator